jgi:hypothetical protein
MSNLKGFYDDVGNIGGIVQKEKLDESQIRTGAIIKTLVTQRNTAMNYIADLQAEITFLKEKLKQYESEPQATPVTNGCP